MLGTIMRRKGDHIHRSPQVGAQSGAGGWQLHNLVATYIPSSMMMTRHDSGTGIPSGMEILRSMEVMTVKIDKRDGADRKDW